VFGPIHQNVALGAWAKSAIYDCYDMFCSGFQPQQAMNACGWCAGTENIEWL